MANLTRYDPFKELARFNPSGDWGDMFKGFHMRPWLRDVDVEPQIKIDVSEDDKAYTVKADIPGVDRNDIRVQVDGNQVSISAEMKREKEEKKGEVVLRSERYFGRQYRSFSLGHDIDAAKSEAKYQNGVLELVLPKSGNGAGKELKVS
jgi:HSP20 family protein